MPLFQYAGFLFNFNCKNPITGTLVSSLTFTQAVQSLGSTANEYEEIISMLNAIEHKSENFSF